MPISILKINAFGDNKWRKIFVRHNSLIPRQKELVAIQVWLTDLHCQWSLTLLRKHNYIQNLFKQERIFSLFLQSFLDFFIWYTSDNSQVSRVHARVFSQDTFTMNVKLLLFLRFLDWAVDFILTENWELVQDTKKPDRFIDPDSGFLFERVDEFLFGFNFKCFKEWLIANNFTDLILLVQMRLGKNHFNSFSHRLKDLITLPFKNLFSLIIKSYVLKHNLKNFILCQMINVLFLQVVNMLAVNAILYQ